MSGMPKTSELSIEVGDLITHWNAIGLESKEEYEAQLSQRKPGDHVKLRVLCACVCLSGGCACCCW